MEDSRGQNTPAGTTDIHHQDTPALETQPGHASLAEHYVATTEMCVMCSAPLREWSALREESRGWRIHEIIRDDIEPQMTQDETDFIESLSSQQLAEKELCEICERFDRMMGRGHLYPPYEVEPRDLLQKLPQNMRQSKITLQPGSIPLDIWYHIISLIDDLRTLFACGLTCKILAARVIEMAEDVKFPTDSSINMRQMHYDMRSKPLICHYLTEVTISAKSMTAFIYECAGRLRVLKVVKIRGSWDSPEVLPPLRPPVFKAASRFKAVESLELRNICFWSYENLARLVWAFSPVEELKMDNLSWQRGETAHGLANEPFSKPLCPKSIAIYSEDISVYKTFLMMSKALNHCTHLILDITEHMNVDEEYPEVNVSLRACPPDSTPHDQQTLPASSMSKCSAMEAEIVIMRWWSDLEWLQRCFDLLDGVLSSLCTSCLSVVTITMYGTHPVELVRIFTTAPLPFPKLGARGVLRVRFSMKTDTANRRIFDIGLSSRLAALAHDAQEEIWLLYHRCASRGWTIDESRLQTIRLSR